MWLSYHPKIIGKPLATVDDTGRPQYWVNDLRVNLGWGWENHCCDDYREAYDIVTELGLATSSRLSDNHRCEDSFVSRQLCMVDIDSGMSIDEMLQDVFYQECALGYYTTSSHTDEHHRFRVMFVLEDEITDRQTMRDITSGLLIMYSSADQVCRDSTRIYYGVPNCPRREYRGHIVTRDIYQELAKTAEMRRQEQYQHVEYRQDYTPVDLDIIAVEHLLKLISDRVGNLRGDYMVWRTISWAVCSCVGIHNALTLMTKFWPEKTQRERQSLLGWRQHRNGPGAGTLIKLSGISSLDRRLLEIEVERRQLLLTNKGTNK